MSVIPVLRRLTASQYMMFFQACPAFFVIISFQICSGYHVLLFHNVGTKSHLIQMAPLVEELLDRGHQVTGILYGPVKIKHGNYTEIIIPNYGDKVMEKLSEMLMKGGGQNLFNPRVWFFFYEISKDLFEDVGTGMFKVHGVKKLMENKPKIDAVITVMSFGAIFADYFDCPLIFFSPAGPFPFTSTGSGNEINLSLQPNMRSPFIEPMTFFQRIGNHFIDRLTRVFFNWIENAVTHYQMEYFGKTLPQPEEIIEERFSVMIACSHYITHGAWQYLPNVIEVGGLQLKEGKPLPENLQKFMDSSSKGVVFVSFGSTLKPDQMPEEKKAVFIESFKNLEMSVIWKWDEDIPDLPGNVMISSWLPQQDLLAHPNLKVFVTHGGLGSLVEAIYHKATIVGIPFSVDQKPNLLRAVRHGYAKILDWNSLNVDDFTKAVKSAMLDEEMKNSMDIVNSLYVDREVKPRDRAAWWVEYVCKHGGAKWLKTGVKVPWYQYHHVDILAFLSVVVLVMCIVIFFFCRSILRCFCGTKTKTD